jgi:ATP/maltotriose-dependent transcriptional regulator MalT
LRIATRPSPDCGLGIPTLAELTRPRVHDAVPRERLFARLEEERLRRSALCIVGPPGAGKTTLVASWLDARHLDGIWYQVDAGDAELATFFYHLRLAATPFSRKGQRALPLLTPEYLSDIEGFTRRFLPSLRSAGRPRRLVMPERRRRPRPARRAF